MNYTKYNMENCRYLINKSLKTFLFLNGASPGQQDKVSTFNLKIIFQPPKNCKVGPKVTWIDLLMWLDFQVKSTSTQYDCDIKATKSCITVLMSY